MNIVGITGLRIPAVTDPATGKGGGTMVVSWLNKGNTIRITVAFLVLLLLVQVVPYGRNHPNPP